MKKKMNDKGFSLVELIIVVAIMAILIALLAPQYLKFVERSRKSADRDTVDNIIRTVQINYADPEAAYSVEEGASITISKTGSTLGADSTGLGQVLNSFSLQEADIKLKSSQWLGTVGGSPVTSVTITFNYANDNIEATVSGAYDGSGVSITGKTGATPTP